MKTDVVIIGAGAVGCAIARELSRYQLDVTVVEKNEDVGGDASKSNSAIIHTGYDASPGTLESQLVVAANPMYDQLTRDLDIPFKRVGAILPAITEEQYEKLPEIKHKAFMNRVYDVQYKTAEELLEMEPNLNPEVKGGLYIPREYHRSVYPCAGSGRKCKCKWCSFPFKYKSDRYQGKRWSCK